MTVVMSVLSCNAGFKQGNLLSPMNTMGKTGNCCDCSIVPSASILQDRAPQARQMLAEMWTKNLRSEQGWKQGSWGQRGAHLGLTGPRWAPCWPHELCYLGRLYHLVTSSVCQYRYGVFSSIGIPIIKIRWSHGHLIFIIGLLILGKMVFILLEGHACYTVVSAICTMYPWWRQQMETFSTLLALCEGDPMVTSGFHSLKPVLRSYDVFFDLRLNKWLSKQSRWWWFETPSCSLWRHCNVHEICTWFMFCCGSFCCNWYSKQALETEVVLVLPALICCKYTLQNVWYWCYQ